MSSPENLTSYRSIMLRTGPSDCESLHHSVRHRLGNQPDSLPIFPFNFTLCVGGKRAKGEHNCGHREKAWITCSWGCKWPDKPFPNSGKLLGPFQIEMSINLESRQLAMQILSHLIKKKKRSTYLKKKKALWDKQAFCSSLVSSIWSANPPIHLPTTWLAISPTGWKREEERS